MAWATSISVALLLTWSLGFLYWHLKIDRALAEIREEARTHTGISTSYVSRLVGAERRAIPRLLREFKEALARKDRNLAQALCWELRDAWEGADSRDDGDILRSYHGPRLDDNASLEILEAVYADEDLIWNEKHDLYPAWWMWWTGRRHYPRSS